MDYVKTRNLEPTRHLFVGNCGPHLGFAKEDIEIIFRPFSSSVYVHFSRDNASHCYVTLASAADATEALQQLTGKACAAARGRTLIMSYCEVKEQRQVCQQPHVALTSDEANIHGLQLHLDFISLEQEQALLQHIDSQPWSSLAKRRVQHYGYTFEYSQRGVDPQQQLGQLPEWVQPLLPMMESLPDVLPLDQLTVNEYTPGVGLSAHIDTHSAFSGAILSLSLAGGCVMEFRKPWGGSSSSCSSGSGGSSRCRCECNSTGSCTPAPALHAAPCTADVDSAGAGCGGHEAGADVNSPGMHVYLYLPPRALLVMGGEARYCWQHYIPHRKADWVNGCQVARSSRRVSLTFRKVRGHPCDCCYPQFCDSQLGTLPPTRLAQLQQQQQQQQQASAQPAAAAASTAQHSPAAAAAAACIMQDSSAAEAASAGKDCKQSPPASSAEKASSAACSSATSAQDDAAAEAAAAAMEGAHVHAVYDSIAGHFSSTRFAVWPKVRSFMQSLPPHCVVADVGCGNGKYFGVRRDLAVLGSDRSAGLAAVAAQRLTPGRVASAAAAAAGPGGSGDLAASPAADVLVADALQLPYRPCSCDGVLCIAVLHHISSRRRRVRLLQQLAALLAPGGKALVTVWATEQEDPSKTIDKWTKIRDGTQGSSSLSGLQPQPQPPQQQQQLGKAEEQQQLQKAEQQQQQQPGQVGGCHQGVTDAPCTAPITGPDYFVPWHLPFHKAGGLTQAQQQQQQQQEEEAAGSLSGASAPRRGVQGLSIDTAKGAVVLQRYYHLFEHGELEMLIGDVPGVQVVDGFYDRSNWCVIFQKLVSY